MNIKLIRHKKRRIMQNIFPTFKHLIFLIIEKTSNVINITKITHINVKEIDKKVFGRSLKNKSSSIAQNKNIPETTLEINPVIEAQIGLLFLKQKNKGETPIYFL